MSRDRSQVREVINRNTVISLALEQGFNAFLPVYDGGVDFILYRESDLEVRKVQLKSRWTIDRKYVGRDIWIAFPIAGEWYLMRHDEMLRDAVSEGVTTTASWINDGLYSRPRMSAAAIKRCSACRFAPISEVAMEAASTGKDDKFIWKEGDLVLLQEDGAEVPVAAASSEVEALAFSNDKQAGAGAICKIPTE
ncbi:hypothetical protein BH10PSE6_BH10PSE6_08570 [soil metagenome]